MTDDLKALLESRRAVLNGHFQLTSGRHSDTYIEKFRLLQWPDITSDLCGRIAKRYEGLTNLVAGPTTGGVILAFETARQLGTRCIIAEKRGNGPGREFRRGFEVGPEDSVLVVDDVLTTGGSVRDVIGALRQTGATVAGVGMLIDRSGGSTDFGVPFFSCLTVSVESWDPGGCRLCTEGVPLTIT